MEQLPDSISRARMVTHRPLQDLKADGGLPGGKTRAANVPCSTCRLPAAELWRGGNVSSGQPCAAQSPSRSAKFQSRILQGEAGHGRVHNHGTTDLYPDDLHLARKLKTEWGRTCRSGRSMWYHFAV
jgi:hypothetical protein